MNEDGFIFTMDAALMLIPIFIIIATVSGINLVVPHESPYYKAQDALDTLYYSDSSDGNLLTVANNVTSGNTAGAINNNIRKILRSFGNYNFTYYNITSATFQTLDSYGTSSTNATLISTSTRRCGNVTFQLSIWG